MGEFDHVPIDVEIMMASHMAELLRVAAQGRDDDVIADLERNLAGEVDLAESLDLSVVRLTGSIALFSEMLGHTQALARLVRRHAHKPPRPPDTRGREA